MNKKELIQELKKIKEFSDKLTKTGEYCLNECKIVNYNENCKKCSITKYVDSVDPNLKNPLLCWSCDKLNVCDKSPINADSCIVHDCNDFDIFIQDF